MLVHIFVLVLLLLVVTRVFRLSGIAMPASTLDPIGGTLHATFAADRKNVTSGDTLAIANKRLLLQEVDFERSDNDCGARVEALKAKYVVLKCKPATPEASKPERKICAEEELKLAERELFPLGKVKLGWSKGEEWNVGAGMSNMGNTCYLNSTLQALFHVPALVNWLMDDTEHSAECRDSGTMCIICAMNKTLQESQQRQAATIRPILIYNKLRLVCRHLVPGRQEDAHEFLRYLVEAMEKCYLSRFVDRNQFDSRTKETTPLNQILGGYLRSAVRCLKCGHVSTTYQHFQDLLLDVRKAQTVEEALEQYFGREMLDDESYLCEACGKKVPATKQFSVERTPMVLCIQLKRFSISNNKITKHVQFRQRLDLTRYARHRPSVPLIYRLVALVTHMGPTVNCGHYTAVAQGPTGTYYQFDDSTVRVISHQTVFNTNAYIMFYELESSPYVSNGTTKVQNGCSAPVESATAAAVYGPQLPPNLDRSAAAASNGNEVEAATAPPTATPCVNGTKGVCRSNDKKTKLVPYEMDDSTSSSDDARTVSDSNNVAVTNALYKMSAHNGYGSGQVYTWLGSKSQIARDITNENREGRKRKYIDQSEMGKVKRQRPNTTNGNGLYKSNPGYNPIQEYHTKKIWNNKNNGYKPYYNQHRRQFHNKNHRYNHRFRP